MFRAFFFLKLRNVDEFLYIRRVRAGSLTQAPETGIGSLAREAHCAALRIDLGRIKRKELSLEESALRTLHRSDFGEVRIDRLRRGEVGRGFVRDAWEFVARLAGRAQLLINHGKGKSNRNHHPGIFILRCGERKASAAQELSGGRERSPPSGSHRKPGEAAALSFQADHEEVRATGEDRH